MSEETKATETKRTPFTVDIEPLQFEPTFSGKYISSNELLKLTNNILRQVFGDYEGCKFVVAGGIPTLTLAFNHRENRGSLPMACERMQNKSVGNAIIDRTRNHDRRMKDGDRYYLTEDGMDFIKNLLTDQAFNKGNINWKTVVSDVIDRGTNVWNNPANTSQYTEVSNIDARKICALIWGSNRTDDTVEYEVIVARDISQKPAYGMANAPVSNNFLLNVNVVSAKEINRIYRDLGLSTGGSSIYKEF